MSRTESEFETREPHAAPADDRVDVGWSGQESSAAEAAHSSQTGTSGSPGSFRSESADGGGEITASEPGRFKRRWMVFALVSAFLLTLVTVAGIVLVTRPASTVDQLLILTVPSGANVKFDSQDLGRSPVKLEGVHIGSHAIEISKEGYETISQPVAVTEGAAPLDFTLKPLASNGAGLPEEEQIRQFQDECERAFAQGNLTYPEDSSAIYFADVITNLDPGNQFAKDMRDKIRRALLQSAQAAMARADLAQAQEVVAVLNEHYPNDDAARAAAAKLESQIALHKGDVRDLVSKADDALRAGNLIEPASSSAYYYSKQAMAIDRSNARARAILDQVHNMLAASADQAIERGDGETAEKELQKAVRLFPKDSQLAAKLAHLQGQSGQKTEAPIDPAAMMRKGLDFARHEDYAQAAYDLQYAVEHGQGTDAVLFALGQSYYKLGDLALAVKYLREVPPGTVAHISALGLLGDIAAARGQYRAAIDLYNQAKDLRGSVLYSIPILDDRIAALEKHQNARLEKPSPLSIEVKHLHGGILHGSCRGLLTVNQNGVRFDGSDHHFAANLVKAAIDVDNNQIRLNLAGKVEKFTAVSSAAAEQFKATLTKYQNYANGQQ